ncbi:MAG: asparagine synthase (glutamine-hydrolyzing) [Parvibaculales bacterium]
MCGVFGWIKFNSELSDNEKAQAAQALLNLNHRGPDAQGVWQDSSVFMGHQRLSVIDLSADANQPFTVSGSNQYLSFNGEIYNFVELRDKLTALGYEHRTKSDTEVFFNVLKHWGSRGFNELDGMFAGAWYDKNNGRHILFRDALGQKPLYYFKDQENLIYASELGSILSLRGFNWRIDGGSFKNYLSSGYYGWDTTPILGIKKLLPGTFLEASGNTISISRWWDSKPGEEILDVSPDEAVDTTIALLDDACRLALRSDVPYGVFLSGGIDSSLLYQLCRRHDPNIASFTVGFKDADYDESEKAAQVVDFVGNGNHEVLNVDVRSIGHDITEVFERMDEPHGDPGYLNSYMLSKLARQKITVAIAGDGADELFCGYLTFRALRYARMMRFLPAVSLSAARRVLRLLPASDGYMSFQFKGLSFLNGMQGHQANRHNLWLSTLPDFQLKSLFVADENKQFDVHSRGGVYDFPPEVFDDVSDFSDADKLSYYYQKTFLPEFVSHHTDRASMLNSLEVRSPFLSPRIIEFANSLPHTIRNRQGTQKWPLRQALLKLGFAPSIVKQRKQGFTLPIARWQKTVLREDIERLGDLAEMTGGLIRKTAIEELVDDHLNGRGNNYRILHALMAFKAWQHRYPNLDFA